MDRRLLLEMLTGLIHQNIFSICRVVPAPLGGVSCVPVEALSNTPVELQRAFPDVNVAPTESINEIVNKRLAAVKKLQDNPNDSEAMATLHYAEIQVRKLMNY